MLTVLRKYLLTTRMGFQELLAFRANLFVWTIVAIIPTFLSLVIFRTFGSKVNQDYITAFFLSASLIRNVTILFAHDRFANDIYNGNLSGYLLKPFSYIVGYTFRLLTGPLIKFFLVFPFVIYIIYFLISGDYLPYLNLERVILLVISMAGGYLLSFGISLVIGFLVFWTEFMYFFGDMVVATTLLFSGAVFPLSIFPDWAEKILNYLPFRYVLQFQLDILLQEKVPGVRDFAVFGFYLVVVWVVAFWMFRLGVRKYEAYGN
ncbi:ABC-2 family transporter protein [Candidatus Dojkabacteria bacterium]|nr:ABC-2 family transporter protein [Candidatus Dojkabacteria bacterium]